MPKIIDDAEFSKSKSAPVIFDWHSVMDGALREFTEGVDFTCNKTRFQNYCHVYAKNSGFVAQTKSTPAGLMARFVPKVTQ